MLAEISKAHNSGRVQLDYSNHDEFMRLPLVSGDASALMTVFRNLVENAVKYTRLDATDSRILLGHRLAESGFLEILVEDNGIGIPPSEEDWIFVDGYRCDNAMRRRPGGGSGIGLPHSKQLMKQMGGNLYFERVANVTRFVVRLKIAQET
jgi:signal transduction histidine kinase